MRRIAARNLRRRAGAVPALMGVTVAGLGVASPSPAAPDSDSVAVSAAQVTRLPLSLRVVSGWPAPRGAVAAGRPGSEAGTVEDAGPRSSHASGAAPPGDSAGPVQADAYGASLDFLGTCLGCTTAQAGSSSSGAEAREARVAGEPVSEGQIPANGYSSGSLLTLPANPLLGLAILGWEGFTRADGMSSQAHARGALLDLTPGEGGATSLTLGESRSDAAHTGASSRAASESDGARAVLGQGRISLVVLHSESSSDHPGRVYLAALNGREILPSTRSEERGVTVPLVTTLTWQHRDGAGAVGASVSDGRAQRMAGIGTTWAGRPSSDPQPLQ